jgi:ubiquitin-conjugating enzyme E2 variant
MEIFLGIVLAWVIAEVVSGLAHHFEDRYGDPDWQFSLSKTKRFIYKSIIAPNIMHHKRPAAMLEGSYWHRNNSTIVLSLVLAGLSYLILPSFWPLYCGFLLMSQANEIHGWAHKRNNTFIRMFQSVGLLQSPKHHKIHHTVPYNTNYCVMTNYLNPILATIGFWKVLEFFYWLIFGLKSLKSREVY